MITVKKLRTSSSESSTGSYSKTVVTSPKKINEKKTPRKSKSKGKFTKKKARFKVNTLKDNKTDKTPKSGETQPKPVISVGEEVVTIKREEEGESSDVSIDVEEVDDGLAVNETKPLQNSVQEVPKTEPSEEIVKQLESMELPTAELVLDQNIITDLEKYVNSDFFDGRPAKTPERYLKVKPFFLAWDGK